MLQFGNPLAFWLLLPTAVLAVLLVSQRRARRTRLTGLRALALVLGFIALTMAIARPQIGHEVSQRIALRANVFLALDISKSMTATDVVPSRLGLVTTLAAAMLPDLEGLRLALFPFAEDGFLLTPLSSDVNLVREMLGSIGPSLTTNQGTNLEKALSRLLQVIHTQETSARDRGEDFAPSQIVLFSDGESHSKVSDATLGKLRARRIPVHTVLVGTEQGARIRVDLPGRTGGQMVLTKAESEPMRRIAQATHGSFTVASLAIAPTVAAKVRRSAQLGRLSSSFKVEQELYPYLLLSALAFFAVDLVSRGWQLALRGLALFLLVAAPASAERVWTRSEAFADGSPRSGSRAAYDAYNEGVGAMRLENPKAAVELFQEAATLATDPELKKRALYNLGNSLLRMGDPAQALSAYQQARDVRSGNKKFDEEANRRISDNIALATKLEQQRREQMRRQQQGRGDKQPEDRQGPETDYEGQRFSEEEKKKLFELMAAEERNILQRTMEERNGRTPPSPNAKPW
jgi:Ca-activated chloride channel family protein